MKVDKMKLRMDLMREGHMISGKFINGGSLSIEFPEQYHFLFKHNEFLDLKQFFLALAG